MGSPYREAPGRIPEELRQVEIENIASYDVSGHPGANGRHGARGFDGSGAGGHGGPGQNAGLAQRGQNAGSIKLVLETTDIENVAKLSGQFIRPDGTTEAIDAVETIASTGSIDLVAIGGAGGPGGWGGDGGNGARGRRGSDATRYTSGSNGGPGGNGGNGGNGTSGAPGGSGGNVEIQIDEDSTQLLMLIRHAVDGGVGGKPGKNGNGGFGGPGGAGGSSYSWTEYYTDSEGNTKSRSHYNAGGSNGRSGSPGIGGQARLVAGDQGPEGQLVYSVRGPEKTVVYTARYHLRLVSFDHESSNEDSVYEPREEITVTKVCVENVGGMPTPKHSDIHVTIGQKGWVDADERQYLRVPRGLEPGARAVLDGKLTFNIAPFKARESAEPLEILETIHPVARVEAVRREFDQFQAGEAVSAGEFVIRFPVRCAEIQSMHSLAPDTVSKMTWSVTNQSRIDLGRDSECGRRLRVRLMALESELGDAEITLFNENDEPLEPSSGYSRELDLLESGGTEEFQISIGAKTGAPARRAITMRLALELGDLEAPDDLRTIQLRDFTTRIANRYRERKDANLLLVINHTTTAAEVAAWKKLASLLGFRINLWDVSLEGHFDVIADQGGTRGLIDHFAGGTIVFLNNEIETAEGTCRPHEFLSKEDVYALNSAAIHIAFIGADPDLDRLLMPLSDLEEAEVSESPDELVTALAKVPDGPMALVRSEGKVEFHNREWWGGLPDITELGSEAGDMQDELVAAYPDRRYVVVYDFDPEVTSRFLWIKKWKMGDVEVKSTLDPVAGSIVHAKIHDLDIHAPEFILRDSTFNTMLLARSFNDNLNRLGELLAASSTPALTDGSDVPPEPTKKSDTDDPERFANLIVGAMLAELASEQDSITATKWREGLSRDEIREKMPKLAALVESNFGDGTLLPGGEGLPLIELVARLRFFADDQVKLWERTPPIRFLRRAPTVAVITKRWLDDMLESTFGDHAKHAKKMVKKRIDTFEDSSKYQPDFARALIYAPIAGDDVTTDDEIFADAGVRTMSQDDFDSISARDAAAVAARKALVLSQRAASGELLRQEATAALLKER